MGNPRPRLYVVSGSAEVDPAAPALQQGGVVLAGQMTPRQIVDRVRADGHRNILCEGGPGLFAELLSAGLVDELFITVSPKLFGRFAGDLRKALAENRDLHGAELRLLSARRAQSHLLLRYAIKP
jgi:5-amino-6-(5-phosphoribosylamino)uracil reductase